MQFSYFLDVASAGNSSMLFTPGGTSISLMRGRQINSESDALKTKFSPRNDIFFVESFNVSSDGLILVIA